MLSVSINTMLELLGAYKERLQAAERQNDRLLKALLPGEFRITPTVASNPWPAQVEDNEDQAGEIVEEEEEEDGAGRNGV